MKESDPWSYLGVHARMCI